LIWLQSALCSGINWQLQLWSGRNAEMCHVSIQPGRGLATVSTEVSQWCLDAAFNRRQSCRQLQANGADHCSSDARWTHQISMYTPVIRTNQSECTDQSSFMHSSNRSSNCCQQFDTKINIVCRLFPSTRYDTKCFAGVSVGQLVLQFEYFPALLKTICVRPTAGNDVIYVTLMVCRISRFML